MGGTLQITINDDGTGAMIIPYHCTSNFFGGDYDNEEDCEANDFTWQGGFQIIHDDLTQEECEANGYTWFHDQCIDLDAEICIEDVYGCMQQIDVWENWDITLRDLVIVNRYGYEVARLNLTYTNPDPESTCGENYQTIKELIIDAR